MGAKRVDHLSDHRSGARPWNWPWGSRAAFGLTERDLRINIRILRQRQHTVHRGRCGAAHPAAVVENDLAVRKLSRALCHLLVTRDAELLAVWLRVQRTLIEISATVISTAISNFKQCRILIEKGEQCLREQLRRAEVLLRQIDLHCDPQAGCCLPERCLAGIGERTRARGLYTHP